MGYSGYDKAAILLGSLGEDLAAEILKYLDIREVGKISLHMSRAKTLNKADIDEVFKEIQDMFLRGEVNIGGRDFVKKVLVKGLGEDNANKVIEMASNENTIDSLRWIDAKKLTNFLTSEHPQTIAIILCLLEPLQASEVLSSLPDTIKSDVAMRVAATERIPANAIEELEEALKVYLDIDKGRGRKLGGTKTIAEILNMCDRATENLILGRIEEQDSAMADFIKQYMFVFEDLQKVDDRGIQAILKEVSTEELSLALKTASGTLREKIFKNMSQRAAQILKEDMEVRGPVRVSEVEKAQQNIANIAKRLETEGRIVLAGKGGEEIVV